MKMTVRPMRQEERKYSYAQSHQIERQTGNIGYLRGDMGSNGNGFYTTWNDHCRDLKTDAFKQEFDVVINMLRFDEHFGNMLKDRNTLAAYCCSCLESSFGGDGREFGFRADTENYCYLLRLNPNKGEYNLYVYCYKREWFDQHMQRAQKGICFITPDYKEIFRIPDGDKIRITFSNGKQVDRICRYIDDYHFEAGENLYHICEFAERMEQNGNTVIPLRSSLPEMSYSTLPSTGEAIQIRLGERGYWPCNVTPPNNKKHNRAFADKHNSILGVSKAQEAAMLAGSLFGWDIPGADPKCYDAKGNPKHNNSEREETR